METWQIVFVSMYGGTLGYLMLTNIQHGKKLAVIEKVLDQLVIKVDMFLKSELETLKELINRR